MDEKIEAIAAICADYYGVTVEEMKARNGPEMVCRARQTAILLTKDILGCAYRDLAEWYGRGSHSTIMYQYKRAQDHVDVHPRYETVVNRLGWVAQERVLPGSPNPPKYEDQAAANAIIALYFNAVTSHA